MAASELPGPPATRRLSITSLASLKRWATGLSATSSTSRHSGVGPCNRRSGRWIMDEAAWVHAQIYSPGGGDGQRQGCQHQRKRPASRRQAAMSPIGPNSRGAASPSCSAADGGRTCFFSPRMPVHRRWFRCTARTRNRSFSRLWSTLTVYPFRRLSSAAERCRSHCRRAIRGPGSRRRSSRDVRFVARERDRSCPARLRPSSCWAVTSTPSSAARG